ncbi:hypothetical protein [Solicola sp. PLA-1-18]|uniref:hypothetical protein n=1 Tax=Solicola sp. PLA-1-18 TaxID=3380532 RepID=UPI003B81A294
MPRVRPQVPGLDPRAADTFVRHRVLALRATGRAGGERVAMVGLADVGLHPAEVADRCWWEPTPDDAPADRGLRADVVHALLAGAGEGPLLATWTRSGPNEVLEPDLAWRAALARASSLTDRPVPPLVVLTRSGWRCHPTGGHRTWKRLRERGPVTGAAAPQGTAVRPRRRPG